MFESTQAKYLGYPSFLIILLVIANFVRMAVEGGTPLVVWILLAIGFFFATLYLLLGIFNVNCLVMGGCGVWAWFVWFFAVIKLIAIIVSLIITLVMPKMKKVQSNAASQSGVQNVAPPVANPPASTTVSAPVANPPAPTPTAAQTVAQPTTTKV